MKHKLAKTFKYSLLSCLGAIIAVLGIGIYSLYCTLNSSPTRAGFVYADSFLDAKVQLSAIPLLKTKTVDISDLSQIALPEINEEPNIQALSLTSSKITKKKDKCSVSSLKKAVHIRSIQSKLMVAALSCQGAKERYNAFATKYSGLLAQNGKEISTYFQCKKGKNAKIYIDNMVTKIANVAAGLNSDDHANFCQSANTIFDILENRNLADNTTVSETLSASVFLDEGFFAEY